jgi:hypothetical protein
MTAVTETKFTNDQIADFMLYEAVRASGVLNMCNPLAREATGLEKPEYAFVIENYEGLARAYLAMRDKQR